MTESEVIIVDAIPDIIYDSLIEECIKYAIISLPFTVDRMAIPDLTQRALNIAKGKIAEKLFKLFCLVNSIEIDFNICSTPFWNVDNRDFVLNEAEWDIKNNFIYCENALLEGKNYTDLPALIPNRFTGDQWSKRDQLLIDGSRYSAFLFTFLKTKDLINGIRGNEFLNISLSAEQATFVSQLYSEYRGIFQKSEPFNEEWFWREMSNKGTMELYSLHSRPYLIITGCANKRHWPLYKDTGKLDRDNSYQDYLNPKWYTKTHNGSVNFMDGTLWTTITNSTLPLTLLTSFSSLFPKLRSEINYARIKNAE